MTVVTLPAFTPPERGDRKPWTTAAIAEASTQTGSYTTIDTITLSPVDTDPEHPTERLLTSEKATLASGWYRITLSDTDGDTYVLPVVQYPPSTWIPTVDDVGARMYSRTRNASGVQVGTFDTTTTPTGAQVANLLADAVQVVSATVGQDIPIVLWPLMKYAVIAKTAMSIERSGYYPEDTTANEIAYQAWTEEYQAAITALLIGARQDTPNNVRAASIPMRSLTRPIAYRDFIDLAPDQLA